MASATIPATRATTTAMPPGLSSRHWAGHGDVRPALDDTLQLARGAGAVGDATAAVKAARTTSASRASSSRTRRRRLTQAALVPQEAVEPRPRSSRPISDPTAPGCSIPPTASARRRHTAPRWRRYSRGVRSSPPDCLRSCRSASLSAERWLARVDAHNVPDAAAILFAFADRPAQPSLATGDAALSSF